MVTFRLNGQILEVPDDWTVLQAAESIGVTIPTLCYHKDLSPFGGCRLCVVEVKTARLPMTSCNLPVNPGLVVQTDTPEIFRYRQKVLRILLANYYDAAYKRYNGHDDIEQDSELAHWARVYEVDMRAAMAKRPSFPVDSDPNPFVWVDMNKCIQCTRCVRACAEVQGRFVWAQAYRGYKARIVAGADSTMLASRCESCGACAVYCPTGALDHKMSLRAGHADRLVATTCSYCGVGCRFDLNVKDDAPGGRVIRVTSNAGQAPVNGLHLCLKGRYGYEFIHDARRLTRPRVRRYLLEGGPRPAGLGQWAEVDWDTALEIAARGLQAHAPAVGVLASGKLTNEENYLLGKLARQALDSDNIDACAHVYRAPEVDALQEMLGLAAMPNSLDAIAQEARALLVIGSNLTEQHPVFGARIRQAVLRRKVKMVVASPDFVNIAEYAALALYHQPESEATLVNGLMHIILERGWQDPEFTRRYPQGSAEFRAMLAAYPPERAAALCGVSVEALAQAAEILARHRPMAVLYSAAWTDGEAARRAVRALAHLQMLLGNLEVLGGGVNPLRPQNNLQGACDMGCRPGLLPGYQSLAEPAARRRFEDAWGAPLPAGPGLSAPEMLAAARDGQLGALYIAGEEILNTSPQAAGVRQALQTCDFVVLQEIQPSDAARYADVLLPGASFAEKSGTFTNTERRIQLVQQAIEPPGAARQDWWIIAGLAQRILALKARRPDPCDFAGWEYPTSERIMAEIAALTPIYAGVSQARLAVGGLQWPVDSPEHPGTPWLRPGYFTAGALRWMAEEP